MSETTAQPDNPIDLPTGEPVPGPAPSSSPPPPSSSSSSSPSTTKPTRPLAAATLASKTDAFLTHLQRCLATPSGIDTLLLFLCYTSRLTGALSTSLAQSLLLRRRGGALVTTLALTLPRKQTAVLVASTSPSSSSSKNPAALAAAAQLAAVLGTRLKNLGALASEARTIARLWGLLGMYFWAKQLTAQLFSSQRRSPHSSSETSEKNADAAAAPPPQESKLATLIAWTQLLSCTAFQYLENGAYLSGKGVLGWTPQQQGRAYVVASRWLALHTGLEMGKLLATMLAPRPPRRQAAGAESAEEEEDKAAVAAVRRSMVINLAWTPLTLHWATETGFLSDLAVGLGGCIPGIIQMRKLWRDTA